MSAGTDMSQGGLPPDDDEALAAEYVLGTLSAPEREAVAARLVREPDLARAVAAWSERLAPLADTIPEEAPPADLFARIEARIAAEAPSARAGSSAAAAPVSAPAVPTSAAVVPLDEVRRLRRSLVGWRIAAGAMAALAAAAIALVVLAPGLVAPPAPEGARWVAVVDAGGDLPALIVQVDTTTGLVRVRAPAAEVPPQRDLELWLVAGDAAPRSLGLVRDASDLRLAPDLASAAPGATLAVSVEPPGGSTTGAPTGPVVYTGVLIPQ